MDTFSLLLDEFAASKKEFYLPFLEKINGSKIHLPVPVLIEGDNYCLEALIHHLWASLYLAQPYRIMQVCSDKTEYFDLDDVVDLETWKGPIYNTEFELLEERLLLISEEVFENYRLRISNLIVEEYAQAFFKITPPEFIPYYQRMANGFMDWLKTR